MPGPDPVRTRLRGLWSLTGRARVPHRPEEVTTMIPDRDPPVLVVAGR
jgi:hypothetical protein